jgi:hypothetical protein
MAGRISYYGGIVTNGLVLVLDAAKKDSYPGSGTIWRDISGNGNNGTLVNGPTFNSANGGSIVFDGIDDRASITNSINSGQNFTVSSWINPVLLGTTRRSVISNSYNYAFRNGWFLCTAGAGINNTFFLSIGSDAAYVVAQSGTLSINTWQHITAVVTNGGETIMLLKNGQTVNPQISVLSSGTITYTLPQFNIGWRDVLGTPDPYTGGISYVYLYNRALSATEVLQNYNATKGRYGL